MGYLQQLHRLQPPPLSSTQFLVQEAEECLENIKDGESARARVLRRLLGQSLERLHAACCNVADAKNEVDSSQRELTSAEEDLRAALAMATAP